MFSSKIGIIKRLFLEVAPRLLAPCSQQSVTEYRTKTERERCLFSPVLFSFFFFFFFFFFFRYGNHRSFLHPGPLRSPAGGVCAGVLRARGVYGAVRRDAQLAVLARGQLPSPRGPPRHQGTMLEGRDRPVSGECPASSQNQPVSHSPLKPAVRGEVKPAGHGSLQPQSLLQCRLQPLSTLQCLQGLGLGPRPRRQIRHGRLSLLTHLGLPSSLLRHGTRTLEASRPVQACPKGSPRRPPSHSFDVVWREDAPSRRGVMSGLCCVLSCVFSPHVLSMT